MSGLGSFNCEVLNSDNLAPDLVCPICKELMNRPVSLTCGHAACKACMLAHLGSGSTRCSLCRAPILQRQFNISVPLSSLIAKIDIRCTNDGCSWQGKQQERSRHSAACPFLLRNCPHGCSGSYRLQTLTQHLEICPYEKLKCQHCTTPVARCKLQRHEDSCNERPKPCPLGCGETFKRSHVHLHIQDCCKRVKKCSVSGCDNFFRNGDEFNHRLENWESHQELLQKEVESLRCSIFNKSNQVNASRELCKRKNFTWSVKSSKFYGNTEDIVSPLFGFDRNMFKCIWIRGHTQTGMILRKVIGSTPITVRARFALLKDGAIKVFDTPKGKTLNNGQMIGVGADFGQFKKDQDLVVKIILIVYRHT